MADAFERIHDAFRKVIAFAKHFKQDIRDDFAIIVRGAVVLSCAYVYCPKFMSQQEIDSIERIVARATGGIFGHVEDDEGIMSLKMKDDGGDIWHCTVNDLISRNFN
ncbi:hypothetical protein GEMRC1_012688 [Eukaryota sp. GEM-RC1]